MNVDSLDCRVLAKVYDRKLSSKCGMMSFNNNKHAYNTLMQETKLNLLISEYRQAGSREVSLQMEGKVCWPHSVP